MLNTGLEFKDFFSGLAGQFTEHIDKSIPDYANNRAATAYALSTLSRGRDLNFLDVGASDGTFGDLVLSVRPNSYVLNMDPNPEMFKNYSGRAHYIRAAWVEAFTDEDEGHIPYYQPDATFDVIHMSMVRQFVTRETEAWYTAAKTGLLSEGLFVYNAKVGPSKGLVGEYLWDLNEADKNALKSKHFTQEQMDVKATQILEGMNDNLLSVEEELAALRSVFKYAEIYWTSYNFYGFVASDDHKAVWDFIARYKVGRKLVL